MATLGSVEAALVAAAIAQTNITAFVPQPLAKRDTPAVNGVLGYSIALVAGFEYDSNTGYPIGDFTIGVVHHLNAPTREDLYFEGKMAADQLILMDPAFWRVTGVKRVVDDPEADRPERIGNMIEYVVTTQLAIVP